MITAPNFIKELRVGNHLYSDYDRKRINITVDDFQCMGNYLRSNHGLPYLKVALNDRYLCDFGFQPFPWGWVKRAANGFGFRLTINSYYYEVAGNNSIAVITVHQLQNLYFSLTGEELIVSEE